MAFETRRYLIIPASQVNEVNFNQVFETSAETCRYSVDGTKTFVKYDISTVEEDIVHTSINPETGEEESSTLLAGVYGRPSIYTSEMREYTHSEILAILAEEEWTTPMPE
jgi:hypothetical protein